MSAESTTQTMLQQSRSLRRSVLSSSSDCNLADLIREVREVSDVAYFDLLVLRAMDIAEFMRDHGAALQWDRPPLGFPVTTSTDILAIDAHRKLVQEWVKRQLDVANQQFGDDRDRWNRITALATYFPDITSRSQKLTEIGGSRLTSQELAVKALANTVKLAIELKNLGYVVAPPGAEEPAAVVEMVCGTILDQCYCPRCEELRRRPRPGRVEYAMLAAPDCKIRLLCDSLEAVHNEVRNEYPQEGHWALAMELEPGPTYVLRDVNRIRDVFAELDERDAAKPPEERLAPHVGLNLDIAHMKIAEVPVTRTPQTPAETPVLDEFANRIVHAHVCDHPGMHTRDQVVGNWHPIDRGQGDASSYVNLLRRVPHAPGRPPGLPFSHAVALELEGCNRIAWIHQSLCAMKRLFAIT